MSGWATRPLLSVPGVVPQWDTWVGVGGLSNLRFWVAEHLRVGMRLSLSKTMTHRLCRVMRLKPGSLVRLFNGSGLEYIAELVSATESGAVVQLQESYKALPASPLIINLGQGVAKGEKMDWIVQKISELGVARFTPLLTEQCDMHLNVEQCAKRRQHWQAVAVAAAEQSGRDMPLVVEPVVSFKKWLNGYIDANRLVAKGSDGSNISSETVVLLHPSDNATSLNEWLASHGSCNTVTALVGPEGGWSESELKMALDCGVWPLKMGFRVLRTETAGMALAAILQARLGDLG